MRDEPFDTLGHELVEVPFIWIPDDYNGPRPGYPWFEAGRMTLSAEQLAAWPPCRITPWGAEPLSSNDAANVQQGAGEASTGSRPSEPAPADGPGQTPAAGASERARRYFDQSDGPINAAIKALRSLSDPGAALQTLDRAFASVSAMTSGSPASRGDPSGLISVGEVDASLQDKKRGVSGLLQQAQYAVPVGPAPVPLPPVFIPGTPANNDFVNSTIEGFRAIGNAIGTIFNSDGSDPGDKPASTPTGQSGSPIDISPGTNQSTTIGGRVYTGHSLDQMQGRGVPPAAVEDAIQNGQTRPGNTPGTTVHNGSNGVVVVTGSSGQVITVINR